MEGWIIKKDEEPTLAKIAILNQLANGCTDFSTELRWRCSLLQVHLENSASQKPSLTEMIPVALGQFNNEVFVRSIDNAAKTTDKFARVINFVAQEIFGLYTYLGSKAYHFKRIIEEHYELKKLTEEVNRSLNSRDNKDYSGALRK